MLHQSKRGIFFLTIAFALSLYAVTSQGLADTTGAASFLSDPADPGDMGDLPGTSDLENPRPGIFEQEEVGDVGGDEDMSGASSAPVEVETHGGIASYASSLQSADIVSRLHQANSLAIELSRLAREKASSPWVQKLAQRMEMDNSFANRSLMKIADAENIALPLNKAVDLDQKNQSQEIQALQNLTGTEFDLAFLQRVLAMQEEKAVVMMGARSQLTGETELVKHITKFSPLLEQHKTVAGNLASNQGAGGI